MYEQTQISYMTLKKLKKYLSITNKNNTFVDVKSVKTTVRHDIKG